MEQAAEPHGRLGVSQFVKCCGEAGPPLEEWQTRKSMGSLTDVRGPSGVGFSWFLLAICTVLDVVCISLWTDGVSGNVGKTCRPVGETEM